MKEHHLMLKTVTLLSSLALCLSTGCSQLKPPHKPDSRSATSGPGGMNDLAVVEAYLEYVGPPEKWAGPKPFTIHVDASREGPIQIKLTSAFEAPELRSWSSRTGGEFHVLGVTETRAQLTELARLSAEKGESFQACVNPVRVRLIRADQSVVERLGCRGQGDWAAHVSQLTSLFMEASIAQSIHPSAISEVASSRHGGFNEQI